MKLLLVRHAKAEEKDRFSKISSNDDLRPLTAEGIEIQKKASRGLKEILPELTLVVSSPLVRAVQTAEVLTKVYGLSGLQQTSLLSPGESPVDFVRWLRKTVDTLSPISHASAAVACVGHEPDLGGLGSYILSAKRSSFIEFKKSGAALIEFTDSISEEGTANLKWFMTPSQLSALAQNR